LHKEDGNTVVGGIDNDRLNGGDGNDTLEAALARISAAEAEENRERDRIAAVG
jgi:Ca2+-binding RTX toxin-like protein